MLGVGEPDSDPEGSIPPPQQHLLTSNTGDEEPSSTPPLAREPSKEVFAFRTPRRPSKTCGPSSFYNGLDSCAGAKLLMSPAIARCSKVTSTQHPSDLTSIRVSSMYVCMCACLQ